MAKPKIVCMIPARLGSERIPQKNLAPMGDTTLLGNAIRIASAVKLYDEVWVNTADERLALEARKHGAKVHERPYYADDGRDSLWFKREFTERHDADYIVNHNPTAPLLLPETCDQFCEVLLTGRYVALHTVTRHQGYFLDAKKRPVNFGSASHPRTQDLPPMYEVCWAVFGWGRNPFLASECGVWAEPLGIFVLQGIEGFQVRHGPEELEIAQLLHERHRCASHS